MSGKRQKTQCSLALEPRDRGEASVVVSPRAEPVMATPAPESPAVTEQLMEVVCDGENLLLVDWQAAGPNEAFHDLATISMFLRMDERACMNLLAAYDEAPVSTLSMRFIYVRRLVALLCGSTFLRIARQSGHAGATGAETLASTLALGDFYQKLNTGSLSLSTAEGQWAFGLALIKESGAA